MVHPYGMLLTRDLEFYRAAFPTGKQVQSNESASHKDATFGKNNKTNHQHPVGMHQPRQTQHKPINMKNNTLNHQHPIGMQRSVKQNIRIHLHPIGMRQTRTTS